MVRFADDPAVRHRIVFLPDYDMSMARYLYWGCDVWLNNPLRPLEACGTSGMKSALNGGLNLSVRDGWWDELYDGRNGWAIPTADGVDDPDRRDDIEAEALYDLMATQVAPLFYDRGADGVPDRWTALVRHTLATLSPKVQASRMVQDYVLDWYAPAAAAARQVSSGGYAGAKELAEFRARLDAAWPAVRVAEVDVTGSSDTPVLGAPMTVRAAVELGGLASSDVLVQAVVGRADDADELTGTVVEPMSPVDRSGDAEVFEATVALPHAGVLGYTVRVLPANELLASPVELGKVVLPA
jgi:starch phosphorylase